MVLACAVVSVALVLGTAAYLRYTGEATVPGPRLGATVALVVAQSLLLLGRGLAPVWCLAAVSALQVVVVAVLPVGVELQGAAPLVAAYTVGLRRPLPRAVPAVLLLALLETVSASVAVSLAADGDLVPETALAVGYGVGSAVNHLVLALLGAFVGTRRAYTQMLRTTAEERVVQERTRAARAVLDERARMARELHDIAAHHLSGMVVQAAAVERLIDSDPEQARAVTHALRLQGKSTLTSLRTAVGILREHLGGPVDGTGGLDDDGGPVPGVVAIPALVGAVPPEEQVRTEVTGEPWDLPPVADVTVYRVVQEGLSNARQHAAGAPVVVRLSWEASGLRVEVENSSPSLTPAGAPADGSRQGLGLLGMHERADLVGATLHAGATPSGGWLVRLRVPNRHAPAAGGEHP